jgi:hypothetical protein
VNEWGLGIEPMFESMDIAEDPCDDCGVTGQSKLYVDGHIFKLCAACAWKLTEEYHRDGLTAPWEAES